MCKYFTVTRNFGPIFDNNSKILILGSFPSFQSREKQFYYSNPQNRFWPLLACLFGENDLNSIDQKQQFVLAHNIALWDVIETCDIIGSSDSSIKNIVPVDIMKIINCADIKNIYCNGSASYNYFMKFLYPICNNVPIKLPSTSPANATWTLEQLIDAWKIILEDLL